MSNRTTRLNSLVGRELSLLLHGRFCEETKLLTITRVEVAQDLTHARIYFSAPDADGVASCRKFFGKKRGELKRLLAQRIPLHHFPELHFCFDQGMVNELRVNHILDTIAGPNGNRP
jgi:ribosome-binding factor A